MIEQLYEYLFSVEQPQAAFWALVGMSVLALANYMDRLLHKKF